MFFGNANAQNKIGLDHRLSPIEKDESPIYFLKYQSSDEGDYTIQLFYGDGKVLMKGTSKDSLGSQLVGKSIWYYKNGNVQSEGEYVNGQKQGTWLRYNEDGSRKSDRHYSDVNMDNIIFNSALYMPKPVVDYKTFEDYIKAMVIKNRQFDLLTFTPIAIQLVVTNQGVVAERKYDNRLSMDEMKVLDDYINLIPSWKSGSNGTQKLNVRVNYEVDLTFE